MPGLSGLRTCEEIRKVSNVPVLFLTAKAQESDKLIGLMAGGDDYLPKPFSYAELLGRVKALLRRYNVYMGRNVPETSCKSRERSEIPKVHQNLRVYKDEIQVFDLEFPEQEIWEEEIAADNYAWESYYKVEFSDGMAEVTITGAYIYQFYNYVMIAEMILSFFRLVQAPVLSK